MFPWNTAANYVGCLTKGTFEACGDYASNTLTAEICTTCCGLAGYQFSALRNGEQCWCSNALDMSSIVGEPQCNEPCSGNIVLRCGGRESYSVYQALGNYNFSFEVTVPESTFVYERITATYSSYPGASYTLDFGEDVVFTTENTSVSYIYHTDGRHSGYGRVLLGEYGEAQTKFTSWAVSHLDVIY